jgi:hypothetical protein
MITLNYEPAASRSQTASAAGLPKIELPVGNSIKTV